MSIAALFRRALYLTSIVLVAPAASAQLPDIRGMIFDVNYQLELGGKLLGTPLVGIGDVILDPLPSTFDVLPDPAHPSDPRKVIIRTRLPFGPDDSNLVKFSLPGRYSQLTGALTVSGKAHGPFFFQTPFDDDAGGLLPQPMPVWLAISELTLKLDGVVKATSDGAGGVVIAIYGTNNPPPLGQTGNLIFGAGTTLSWLAPGTSTPGAALAGPLPVDGAYGAVYEWIARFRGVFGDLNGDGAVNQLDLVLLREMLGNCPPAPAACPGDLDADGDVDGKDLAWLLTLI